VLAVAVVAGHANRPTHAVDDDDRVEAIGLARAAVIFEGLTGPEGAIHDRYCASDSTYTKGLSSADAAQPIARLLNEGPCGVGR